MTLAKGNSLPKKEISEITRDQLKQYAKASLDHNPIHLDDSIAKKQGLKSVIAHGMLSMAFLAEFVAGNFSTKRVKRLRTRFRKMTFPGDRLVCEGEVKGQLESGNWRVEIRIRNQDGVITTEGAAEILPA